MKIFKYFFYIILIAVFASCAANKKTEFTQDIRNRLEAGNIDISRLQYYISNDITLSRELSSEMAKVVKGEVIFQNGKYYENINLKANTPGVCVMAVPRKMNVSFEDGNSKSLQFYPAFDGVYQLSTADALYANPGAVLYNGIPYLINYANNPPILLIKKSVLNQSNNVNRTMKGRTIN